MRLIRGISQSLCALLLLLTSAAHAAQNQEQRIRNIVLVHGAWADGSGWKGVCDILVKHGYNVSIAYSIKVTAPGGRSGSIHSGYGLLDLKLALPRTLGGKGGAINPEQLPAGGYAACFENAIFRASREARHHFADQDVEVVANIGLSRNASGAFVLSAALPVTMAGVDQSTGQQLVKGARAICPCANAIKGSVDVQTTVSVREKEAGEAA